MSNLNYEDPKTSKLPVLTLTTRVTTLVTLAVSMGVLRSDSVTYKVGSYSATFNYNNVDTYKYVFFGMVAGFIYTLFHVPFAMYFFYSKKRLINTDSFLLSEFYGDKICLTILATVVGSLLGATVETKKYVDSIQDIGGYDAKDYRSKVGEFCMIIYVSAIFLIIGFFSSIITSIMSSRALASKS